MPDDPRSNPDDLEHAFFDAGPGAPSHHDEGDLAFLFDAGPSAPSHPDEPSSRRLVRRRPHAPSHRGDLAALFDAGPATVPSHPVEGDLAALFDAGPTAVPSHPDDADLAALFDTRPSAPSHPDDADLAALFDTRPSAPSHPDEGDLEIVLFGIDDGTGVPGAAVGYAEGPLSRTRRVLVGLAVVAMAALVVTATVAFANDSDNSTTNQVRIPARSNVTSTSVALRAPSSIVPAATPTTTPVTTDKPSRATTRRRTTTGGAAADVPPKTSPAPPLNFPKDSAATVPTTRPPITATADHDGTAGHD